MANINLKTYRQFDGTILSGAFTNQTVTCNLGYSVTVVLYNTLTNSIVTSVGSNVISAVKVLEKCTQTYTIVDGNAISIDNYLNKCCVGFGALVNLIDADNDANGYCLSNSLVYNDGFILDLSPYGGSSTFMPTSAQSIVDAFANLPTPIQVTVNGCSIYFPIDYNDVITPIEVNKLDAPVAIQSFVDNLDGTFTVTQDNSTFDPLGAITDYNNTITWTDALGATQTVTFDSITDPNIAGITWVSPGVYTMDPTAFLAGQNSTLGSSFSVSLTVVDSFSQTDTTLTTDPAGQQPLTIGSMVTVPLVMFEVGRAGVTPPQYGLHSFDQFQQFLGTATNGNQYASLFNATSLFTIAPLVGGMSFTVSNLSGITELYADYIMLEEDGVTPILQEDGITYIFNEEPILY